MNNKQIQINLDVKSVKPIDMKNYFTPLKGVVHGLRRLSELNPQEDFSALFDIYDRRLLTISKY